MPNRVANLVKGRSFSSKAKKKSSGDLDAPAAQALPIAQSLDVGGNGDASAQPPAPATPTQQQREDEILTSVREEDAAEERARRLSDLIAEDVERAQAAERDNAATKLQSGIRGRAARVDLAEVRNFEAVHAVNPFLTKPTEIGAADALMPILEKSHKGGSNWWFVMLFIAVALTLFGPPSPPPMPSQIKNLTAAWSKPKEPVVELRTELRNGYFRSVRSRYRSYRSSRSK